MAKLTFLGTGNALVRKCYNTCFVLDSQGEKLLVDAGGGNGILTQLEKASIDIDSIHHLFLTHTHTDHILGCVWIIRVAMQMFNRGKYSGKLHVYSHEKGIASLRQICMLTLPKKVTQHFDKEVIFHILKDRQYFDIGTLKCQCFDILSKKELQFGFLTTIHQADSNVRLVCLGDEPFNEGVRELVEGTDWLLSEAFCLYADRDIHHPYEKHHSTVRDAAILAEQLQVKNLVLYHSVDANLAQRKELFTTEAKAFYTGKTYIPNDLDVIEI